MSFTSLIIAAMVDFSIPPAAPCETADLPISQPETDPAAGFKKRPVCTWSPSISGENGTSICSKNCDGVRVLSCTS